KEEVIAQEQRAEEKRAEVKRLEEVAQQARLRAMAAQEQARRTLYAADMQLAHAAWQTDNVQRLAGLLERHRPETGAPDLRGFEWNYLWRLSHRERFTLHAHPPHPRPAAAKPT